MPGGDVAMTSGCCGAPVLASTIAGVTWTECTACGTVL